MGLVSDYRKGLNKFSIHPGAPNPPIIFAPTAAMMGAASAELAFVVSSGNPNYGGCIIFMSLDGGSKYDPIGVASPAATGVLSAGFALGADPDVADTLAVDLTESLGSLGSVPQSIADLLDDPCLIANPDGSYELVCPTVVTLTSAHHYSFGTYIRRGALGTAIAAHLAGARFADLGAAFYYPYTAAMVGVALHFKFAAFNKMAAQQVGLADCTDYTFTPLAAGFIAPVAAKASAFGRLPSGPAAFADPEVPAGVINGTDGSDGNATFTLLNIPNPPGALPLFKDGQRVTQGVAYTLAGNTITYLAPYIPIAGASHVVDSYRY